MATRPVFVPDPMHWPYVRMVEIEFKLYPGFDKTEAQKSIRSLHEAAKAKGFVPLLEISSKSPERLGVSLSAFNLIVSHRSRRMSVECAFQGSKVFERGGPYQDLYTVSSRDARTDPRLRSSGKLIAFRLMKEEFPTQPVTAFYDWLYMHALAQNRRLADQIGAYAGFTDIAFNPYRSWNCQARSAALFVALERIGKLEQALSSVEGYLQIVSDSRSRG